jgi:trigger factor
MSTHAHAHHAHDIDFKKAFTVTKEPGSQVKIEGEIPYSELEHERARATLHLGQNIKLDGFRAGHVPEAILVKHIGEMAVLTEMAERALAHMYPHIVEAHELHVIGHPNVSITKLAPGNPLGFSLTVAIIPEVTLPAYQALAKTINADKASSDVTDEEVEKQVADIMRQKIAYERLQAKAAANTATPEAGAADLPTPESEAAKTEEAAFDPENIVLPELTDDYVKGLGQPGQFETVADFKAKIKEHLGIEKAEQVKTSHRAKLTDAIVEASTIELPKILIDSELNQMFAQMEEDIKRAGLQFDDYLEHIKKTKEELAAEWQPMAEKRAKLQLVLNEIAKKEEVKLDEKQLEEQTNQLLEQYKDADPVRVRVYIASVMQNEAVMQKLEAAE